MRFFHVISAWKKGRKEEEKWWQNENSASIKKTTRKTIDSSREKSCWPSELQTIYHYMSWLALLPDIHLVCVSCGGNRSPRWCRPNQHWGCAQIWHLHTNTHTHMLYVYVGVLSSIFNSDLQKEQEAPGGNDEYARLSECVCVSVCRFTFVCLPDNATSCRWTLPFIFFVYFSALCNSAATLHTYTEKMFTEKIILAHTHTHSISDRLAAGNRRADVLSMRFLSHPSHNLSPKLHESGWEGPERDRSIRLLWQGWEWHLNPQRQGREEEDEQEVDC